jgi:hypothetical protein
MALHQVRDVMTSNDHFDSEDVNMVDKAIDLEERSNEHLKALRAALPRRQHDLEQLDEQYHLSVHYPEMMKAFARKDAEIQANIKELETQEQQRSEYTFTL